MNETEVKILEAVWVHMGNNLGIPYSGDELHSYVYHQLQGTLGEITSSDVVNVIEKSSGITHWLESDYGHVIKKHHEGCYSLEEVFQV